MGEALTDKDVPTVLGRLRVRVGGSGPAMMFWPSLLMDSAMWSAQAGHFGAGHQVILVDPPGHGASQLLSREFTFDDCARCIVQILDAIGVAQVVATIQDTVKRLDATSGRFAVRSVVPRRPDQLGLMARIQAPVLVVAGIEDATFPVAETRAMADAIPGARFVVLDNAAHLAALEVPDQVNKLIEEFIGFRT